MTQPRQSSNADGRESGHDLWKRTLRTTAILVGACVLFVGTLSTVAVVIASKVAGAASGTNQGTGSSIGAGGSPMEAPPVPNKTLPAAPHSGMKSQSI